MMPFFAQLTVYLIPVALINIGNVCAFLFQLILARYLTIEEFGAFNSLFALANIGLAPASIVPFVLVRMMLAPSPRQADEIGTIMTRSALIALAGAVACVLAGLALASPLRAILHIGHRQDVVLAFAVIGATLLQLVATGWMQGQARHIASAAILAGGPGLRFAFGITVLPIWANIESALAAAACPGLVVFALAAWTLRRAFRWVSATAVAAHEGVGRFMSLGALTTLLLFAFWNLDVVLVRVLFSPRESGLYAMAAAMGRIPYLAASAVANVLFPEAIGSRIDRDSAAGTKRSLTVGFAVAAAIGLAAAVALAVLSRPLLVVLAGSSYAEAAPLLQVIAFAMAALAMVQITATYFLARSRYSALMPLCLALACFFAYCVRFSSSSMDVAVALLGSIIAALGLFGLLALNSKRPAPSHI